MSLMLSLSYIFILLCTKYKQCFFLLVGNFAEFSFSGRIMTAYGLGDSAHRVLRGREPEDVKDLGR
jgi:hypothetical protein